MPRDTISHTFLVAFLLCVVCSVLVSGAAVGLRDRQQEQRALDRQKNILMAAGLLEHRRVGRAKVEELYQRVEEIRVDLQTGEIVGPEHPDYDKMPDYDQRQAVRDPEMRVEIPARRLPGIRYREKISSVYLVKDEQGQTSQIVLPVYGRGLWSTLYGFLALNYHDIRVIEGLTFYEHGETPGLGGEVDNEAWKAQWKGKKAFDEDGTVQVGVARGAVRPDSPMADYQVDGLSGATITSNGVEDLLQYWLGDHGFGPYLENVRRELPEGGKE
jgi:Na+-transporting NADH:ubiquinone oxidoreductase subunit C